MNKFIVGLVSIIAFCILWFLCYLVVHSVTEKYRDINNSMESHLGDTIVINKDTCIVTDYSFVNSSYTLSNGSTINMELIENFKK